MANFGIRCVRKLNAGIVCILIWLRISHHKYSWINGYPINHDLKMHMWASSRSSLSSKSNNITWFYVLAHSSFWLGHMAIQRGYVVLVLQFNIFAAGIVIYIMNLYYLAIHKRSYWIATNLATVVGNIYTSMRP